MFDSLLEYPEWQEEEEEEEEEEVLGDTRIVN
jgi:hypothetical protein